MALRIVKATEAIPVDHPIFLIFGQPGIGKSSLGNTAKKAVTLDTDRGSHRAVNRQDTIQIDVWTDVESLDKETLAPYDTVVVDTVGRVLDMMAVEIAKEPKQGKGGSLTLQGFGALKSRFAAWVSTMRSYGKDLVLIAHDKEDKDGDRRIVRPDITGSSYGECMKLADFVGYVYSSGKDRVVDFSPTDQWVGKNPAGWAPLTIPHYAKDPQFLAGLFDQGRAALGKISEASANAANALLDWRAVFADLKAAEEFNAQIPPVKGIKDMALQAQVVKVMMDAAQSKGVTFVPAEKRFHDPARVPSEAPVITQGAPL